MNKAMLVKHFRLIMRCIFFPFAWVLIAHSNIKLYNAIDQAKETARRERLAGNPILATTKDRAKLFSLLVNLAGSTEIINLTHWSKSFLSLGWDEYERKIEKDAHEEILSLMR